MYLICNSYVCSTPPSALGVQIRYEAMMKMFHMRGYFCETVKELEAAVKSCLEVNDRPTIINVAINPSSDRKPQAFNWLTESKL